MVIKAVAIFMLRIAVVIRILFRVHCSFFRNIFNLLQIHPAQPSLQILINTPRDTFLYEVFLSPSSLDLYENEVYYMTEKLHKMKEQCNKITEELDLASLKPELRC